ncbi:MAG TPA: hypothetical protein VIC59_12600, partial [Gemmatimonadota bacterium]
MKQACRSAAFALVGTLWTWGSPAAVAQPAVNDRPWLERWGPSEFGAGDKAGSVNRITPALVLKAV